jgi:transposase-like protein
LRAKFDESVILPLIVNHHSLNNFRNRREHDRDRMSVSLVARAHDVNTNQVFKWRKQYRAGRLDVEPGASTLLPVKISDSLSTVQPARHDGA